jgi:plastocyanin
MRRFAAFAVLTVMLTLAACDGSSSATSSTITLGQGQFTGTTAISVQTGTTVTFDDSAGGPHNLVTGTGGAFAAETGAPSEFGSSGLAFSGGDTKTVTFATVGVYHITCTLHPSMQATITVTAASAQGGGGY